MSYVPRPTSILPNSTSNSQHHQHQQQSSALAARIASKRSELENLRQLRDFSGTMAAQMSVLEEKLATLRDGTEAVACVLANWDNVLRAISMASGKVPQPRPPTATATAGVDMEDGPVEGRGVKDKLPVTLVRIPAQSGDGKEPTARAPPYRSTS